jgi:hypothetical protein
VSLRDFLFHSEPGITLYCGDCREVLPLVEAQELRQGEWRKRYSGAEEHRAGNGRFGTV